MQAIAVSVSGYMLSVYVYGCDLDVPAVLVLTGVQFTTMASVAVDESMAVCLLAGLSL